MLRRTVGEPLLDIVRRIIDTSGVDIELASAVSPAAGARRDNLDLFVKAVAEFQAVDGDVSLSALLAYLTAEDDQGNGLDLATPTAADSVKLLTVHRAKGLEWAHVFLVGVCETRFPSNRSRTLWTSSPAVLPAPLRGDARDLPQLTGYDKAALDAYRADTRAHDQEEELRLGYVAFTRAAHRLSVTSYLWSPRTTPFGPSPLPGRRPRPAGGVGRAGRGTGSTSRPRATPTPTTPSTRPGPGPSPGRAARRRCASRRLASWPRGRPARGRRDLDMIEAARVADWDLELDRLVAEARADRDQVVDVPLPTSLSATALSRLRTEPEAFARELARPMPRQPSPAARFGTRFHAWVEARFGQQDLFDPDELPGQADAGIDSDDDLAELIATFERGPVRRPGPARRRGAVRAGPRRPGGARPDRRGVRRAGRLRRRSSSSTGRRPARTTPTCCSSRSTGSAWAELSGVPLEQVRAAFYFVRSGRVVEPDDLPGRAELEGLLSPR